MTILLQWLVEHAWIFYAACAIGVIMYAVRALMAQKERNLALFTLERDTAIARVIQAVAMVLIFIAIGVVIFISTTFILPDLPIYNAGTPLPTSTSSAGVEPLTPGVTPTSNPTPELVIPTSAPVATAVSVPTPPPPEPTEVPTPAPTDTPEVAIAGELYVCFSDFAVLVGYSLPAAEITTAQPLPLTLYWKALEGTSPMDYLVFTHLLAGDGHLVAQHDGPPAGGACPITGWTPGETIVDLHSMVFQDTGYTGSARVVVGLYDPGSGRVLTETGDDHVVLPVAINVIP